MLEMGIRPQQLAIFVPSYGRAMSVTQMGNTTGLGQPINGTPEGQFGPGGLYDWRCIKQKDCSGGKMLPSDMVLVSTENNSQGKVSGQPWGSSITNQTVIGYDDAYAACLKAQFVVEKGLSGIMMWELSGDTRLKNGVSDSLGECIRRVLSNPSEYNNTVVSTTKNTQGVLSTKLTNYDHSQEPVEQKSSTGGILNSLKSATLQSVRSKIASSFTAVYHYLRDTAPIHAQNAVNELQTQMPGLLFNASVASAALLLNSSVGNVTSQSAINYRSS
jgi:hypothetical protein